MSAPVKHSLRMSTPTAHGAALTTLLETIRNLKSRQYDLESQIRLFVKAGVHEGLTWREMGEALGTSGQSAWQKYHSDETQKINPSEEGKSIQK